MTLFASRWFAVALTLSCGSVASDPDAATDATVLDAATDDATDGAVDANADIEQPLADAGLFLCVDCYCDGRTSYCRGLSGPHAPIDGDAGEVGDANSDAGICVPNNPTSGCFPYPDACAPAPICTCLLAHQTMVACGCMFVDGGGFDVSCYVP